MRLIKTIIVICFSIPAFILGFTSCNKEENNQLEEDIIAIEKHLEENHIDAIRHESGLFYTILREGDEKKPYFNSVITVNYEGTLLDGTPFDLGVFFTSRLDFLIPGWQIGIPLIGSGGRIKLFIPSPLGYGNKQVGSIPPNSILVFDITLHYFSN